MDKILKFLRPLLKLNCRYPFTVAFLAIILAGIGALFAVHLKIDTDLANLLPHNDKNLRALEKLKQTVGGGSELAVVIRSPNFDDNLHFAHDLLHKSLKLYDRKRDAPFFERGYYKRNTKILTNNALYFATPRELNDITSYLNDQIKNSNKKANPFLVNFEDDSSDTSGVSDKKIKEFENSYDKLIPPKYDISPDSTILLVHLLPNGSKSDLSFLNDMFANYDSLVTAMHPASYNKQMKVQYSGRIRQQQLQIQSILNDVIRSFATGLSSVILLVMLYFFIKKYINYRRGDFEKRTYGFLSLLIRMPVSVLLIGLPLLISLIWTFGITYLVLGTLNTMTSVLFVILFGMGIDYGIHFYARYIEYRSEGLPVENAIFKTYDNTGSAIVVSGLTTAFSLLILIAAHFRGFSEFGFIAGLGIILSLFCMLFVLPSLLVIFERWNWILTNPKVKASRRRKIMQRFPFAKTIVAVGLIISLAVIVNFHHLHFEYDFGKLQPHFEEVTKFQHFAGEAGQGHKRNPAYLLAENHAQVRELFDSLRYKMKHDSTILEIEALPERFPYNKKQVDDKLQKIAQIRDLLNKPVIKNQDNKRLNELRRASHTVMPVSMDSIPPYFKSKFMNKNGEVGNFIIVYPSVNLSNGLNSIAFKKDVGEITLSSGKKIYAASTSILGAKMLELMRSESPWLIGATLFVVFILMLLSFRSLRWTLIAMLPLIVGLLFLFGIMMAFGLKLNIYNLVVLPAILGVGEDNGVHIASRYREEGNSHAGEVLSSTGQHIAIGSLTTMLGFSGLIFTTHPGLQSLGWMAAIGIGMTLLTALTFLPALIQWMDDKNWIQFQQ